MVAYAVGQPVLGVDFISTSIGGTETGGNGGSTEIPDPTPAPFACPECRWFMYADSSWLQKLAPSGVKVDEFYSETIMGRRYTSVFGSWYVWSVYHAYETHNCDPSDAITPLTDSNPSFPTHWGCPATRGMSIQTYGTTIPKDTKVVWTRNAWYEYHTQGIPPSGVSDGLKSLIVAEIGPLSYGFQLYRYGWYQCREIEAGIAVPSQVSGGESRTFDSSYCGKPPYDKGVLDSWGGSAGDTNRVIAMYADPSSVKKGAEPHSFADNLKASEDYYGFDYSYDSVKASCQGWFLPFSAPYGCYYGGSQQTHIVISLIKSTVAEGWNNPNPDTELWFEGTTNIGATLRAVGGLPCGDIVVDATAASRGWAVTYVYRCQIGGPAWDDTTLARPEFTKVNLAAEPGSTHGSSTTVEDTETVAGTWLPTSTTEEHYSDSDLGQLKSSMSALSWTDRIVLARVWTYLSYQGINDVSYGLTGKFTKYLSSGNPNDLWDAQYGIPPLYCEMSSEHGWSSNYSSASCSTDDELGSVGAGAHWMIDCQSVTTGCSYSTGTLGNDNNRETLAQKHARAFTQVTYAENGCFDPVKGTKGCWVESEYYMWISENGNTVVMFSGISNPVMTTVVDAQGVTRTVLSTDAAGTPHGVWTVVDYSYWTSPGWDQMSWRYSSATGTHYVTLTGTNYMIVTKTQTVRTTQTISGIPTTYDYYVKSLDVVDKTVSTDKNGAVLTYTTDSAGNWVKVTPDLPQKQKDLGYTEKGGNYNLNNLDSCVRKKGGTAGKSSKEIGNMISSCGFELVPYSLIPVGAKTQDMREFQLFYDMSTGTFVAIDISGTYGGSLLMMLSPDNPQMYGGLSLPSVPHFALTDQWPYLSVQVTSQTTMYAYVLWAPLLILSPILLVVGLLLRRHDRKERGL